MITQYDPELAAKIGYILWQLREEKGLTQRQAARLVGSTQAQISYIENGKRDILLSTIQHWALAYGYKIDFVFTPINEEEDNEEPAEGISERVVPDPIL